MVAIARCDASRSEWKPMGSMPIVARSVFTNPDWSAKSLEKISDTATGATT